jgi:hypothetical protein
MQVTPTKSVCPPNFAVVLRQWRVASGKKLACAAGEIGVSDATWSHWENGTRFPSGQNLLYLAIYTAIPIKCLVCEDVVQCRLAPRDAKPAKCLCCGGPIKKKRGEPPGNTPCGDSTRGAVRSPYTFCIAAHLALPDFLNEIFSCAISTLPVIS